MELAKQRAEAGLVVISGSVFLVGEARSLLLADRNRGRVRVMSPRPNPLPRFYRWRTNVIQIPLMTVVTAICGSLSLLVSLVEKERPRAASHCALLGAQLWCVSRVARSPSAAKKICAKCPVAVYASNHTSYMDTPVIFAALPFQFRILAKKELWPIAFIGWYLNRSGQIPIDTANPHATLSSLGVGVKALRSGMPLFVFPEGRRTPTAS